MSKLYSMPVGEFSEPMTLAEALKSLEDQKIISQNNETVYKELAPFDPEVVKEEAKATIEAKGIPQTVGKSKKKFEHPLLKYNLIGK